MEVFVARQPIFDRRRNVQAYELLFRSSGNVDQYDGTDASLATTQVLANSMLTIGLDTLVGGKTAFVNFGRELLLSGWHTALPVESTVIEILETVEPDAEVIAACRQIRNQGYQLALDDFEYRPEYAPLLSVVSIVKLLIGSASRSEQERAIREYHRRGLKVLAEKVETNDEYNWAHEAGFDLFQGYFFARPVVVGSKNIEGSKLGCMRLVEEAQRPELDLVRLSARISEDVALSYKLLRYVNSALFHQRAPFESIYQALLFLGETRTRKWIAMAALMSAADDKPNELLVHSLVRARFCELVGDKIARSKAAAARTAEDGFLMGLFSLLDALIDRPLDQALAEVKLAPRISAALLDQAPPNDALAKSYRLARHYETGEWESVDAISREIGLPAAVINDAYCDAVRWADQFGVSRSNG